MGRAQDRAGLRDLGRSRARDAEVRHPRAALGVDEDVVGLQVAMDDAALMREADTGEDLPDDLHRLGRRQPALDQVLERCAIDVLHRDPVAALVLAAVVDRDDVRVLEAGRGLRLAAESLDELLVGAEALMKELEGDSASQHLVVGRPHVRHPAGADPADQPVPAVDLEICLESHQPPASESMTCVAIGPATSPPKHPVHCSIIAATAICGSSAGAKPMNHARLVDS